ncbi:hypothetical protein GFM02_33890 [Rhizobium leguminosarum bv. viciae]|uniref:hypothetical protein n=1 Tax=Rhizobium leguminosarum TaxID=384 RepID=UPI001441468D|nr:hypothetical protein [Rhizobium leguminosarum]NKL03082.1 hypothetical protein [Rhizobium leguminosarum bv. viciae]
MTFHFLIVTTSEDVHRHVGVKKLNIIPKDVRDNFPDLFSSCNVASIIIEPEKNAVSVLIDYLSQDIDGRTGVLLLVEDSLSYVSKILGTGFFISFYDPGLGGKNIQNYFGMVTPKLTKAFAYFARKFDNETFRKMCILPIRNFKSQELADFNNIFISGIQPKGFEDQVDSYFKKMRQRQKPKTTSNRDDQYYVDDNERYFSYGKEEHSLPETKMPPHEHTCSLNAWLRFGKKYDHVRHFNVSNETGTIGGDFSNCHGEVTTVKGGRKHVNMFPNDNLP